MMAVLASYPPLGRVTQTPRDEVEFFVVLEVNPDQLKSPWELALWYAVGHNGQVWKETPLPLAGEGAGLATMGTYDNARPQLYFSAPVPVTSSLRFTLKYRSGPQDPWQWARDGDGVDDGILISIPKQPNHSPQDEPEAVIVHLNPTLDVKSAMSQCPGTQLWTFQANVAGALGNDSMYTDIELGLPWGEFLR
jgi:hypothetical protein